MDLKHPHEDPDVPDDANTVMQTPEYKWYYSFIQYEDYHINEWEKLDFSILNKGYKPTP